VRYKTIQATDARELVNSLLADESPSTADLGRWKGGGAEFDEDRLNVLARSLLDLKSEVSEQRSGATQAAFRDFDAGATVLVHQAIPSDAELLGDFDFWAWLALTKNAEVVLWRFPPNRPTEGGEWNLAPVLHNFGIGQSARKRRENYLYKLWLRAELALHDDGLGDPYRFARRGDVDFWTSHVHRQGYSAYRDLAGALIRFQYPDELDGEPRLFPGQENEEKRGIRTLAKRIKRLQANVEFGFLAPEELECLVAEQARGLPSKSELATT
jgi:hypothetical protein